MKITHKKVLIRKESQIKEIEKKFKEASIAVITDYRGSEQGLTVKDISTLRAKLREQKAEYKIVKNTLAGRALKDMGIETLSSYFNNPTAVVFGYDDPVAAVKAMIEFAKDKKTPKNEEGLPVIKVAYMDGEILEPRKIRALASLPTKAVLMQQLLGLIIAPHQRIMGILNGPSRSMATLLDAYSKKEN